MHCSTFAWGKGNNLVAQTQPKKLLFLGWSRFDLRNLVAEFHDVFSRATLTDKEASQLYRAILQKMSIDYYDEADVLTYHKYAVLWHLLELIQNKGQKSYDSLFTTILEEHYLMYHEEATLENFFWLVCVGFKEGALNMLNNLAISEDIKCSLKLSRDDIRIKGVPLNDSVVKRYVDILEGNQTAIEAHCPSFFETLIALYRNHPNKPKIPDVLTQIQSIRKDAFDTCFEGLLRQDWILFIGTLLEMNNVLILVHLFQCIPSMRDFNMKILREELLLEYALQMSSNNIPLSMILTYLKKCETYGEHVFAELILRQKFETEKEALKLIRLSQQNGFSSGAIQQRIRQTLFTRMMRKGLALPALRVAPELYTYVIDKVLHDIILPNSSLGILKMEISNVYNIKSIISLVAINGPEITFLEYYRDALFNIVQKNYEKSLQLLSIALSEQLISKKYWMILVSDAIELLPQVQDMDSEIVYRFMEALELVILEKNEEAQKALEEVLKEKKEGMKVEAFVEDMRISLSDSLAYSFLSQ